MFKSGCFAFVGITSTLPVLGYQKEKPKLESVFETKKAIEPEIKVIEPAAVEEAKEVKEDQDKPDSAKASPGKDKVDLKDIDQQLDEILG